MARLVSNVLLASLALLLAAEVIPAQESDNPPPETPASPPGAVENEQPPAAEQPAPRMVTDLLSPGLIQELATAWGPVSRNQPQFFAEGNLTLLSVPPGASVYIASVSDIRAAEGESGADLPVENVVFTDQRYVGTTPLTITLETQEYVVAMRAPSRQAGFDGGCVRKTTTDVITGGKRHTYHLYPMRKKAGQYMCFVASFIGPHDGPNLMGTGLIERGTFNLDPQSLAEMLSRHTDAPVQVQAALADSLNKIGLAYYQREDQFVLVKATLIGSELRIDEWPVEE